MSSSSYSATASISSVRAAVRRRRPARRGCPPSTTPCRGRPGRRWPSPRRGRSTPWKSPSAPIGSWIGTGCAPRRSIIVWTPLREVRADAVHLVDVGDARHAVLVGLAPDGLRLRLHAGDRVEQRDGAVEHAQRALHLDGEVHVAGRVDDVDAVVVPLGGGGGRGDRDAALLLLLHPVHGGRALVDLAHLVGAAGVNRGCARSSSSCRRRCAP